MGKSKSIWGNVAAIIYFFVVMLWILLFMIFVPFGLITDIQSTRSIGFSTSAGGGFSAAGVIALFTGISLLVPAFRRMYYKLPWMFPYVKILFVNIVILTIATMILNKGYEVHSEARHTQFFLLMIGQIIVCRVAMSLYFRKKSMQHIGGEPGGQ